MKTKKDLAIGMFDSGMGGISVLSEIINLMPKEKYIYYGDSANAPYGEKKPEEVRILSKKICDHFIEEGVKAIVVACNTATSAAIKYLRDTYDIPIIGMEPALKPAVENNEKGKIAVMATNMTLKEKKFSKLMEKYGQRADIVKLPCPKLVELVETGILEGEQMERAIRECFSGLNIKEVSSVVLGCTHYIFLKDTIRKVLGDSVKIIDGNEGTARHLKNILEENNWTRDIEKDEIEVDIYNSKQDKNIINLSKELLEFSLNSLNFK